MAPRVDRPGPVERRFLAQRSTVIRLLGDDDRSVRSFNYSVRAFYASEGKVQGRDWMRSIGTGFAKFRYRWVNAEYVELYGWSFHTCAFVRRIRRKREAEKSIKCFVTFVVNVNRRLESITFVVSVFFFFLFLIRGREWLWLRRVDLSIRNLNVVLVSQLERERKLWDAPEYLLFNEVVWVSQLFGSVSRRI